MVVFPPLSGGVQLIKYPSMANAFPPGLGFVKNREMEESGVSVKPRDDTLGFSYAVNYATL